MAVAKLLAAATAATGIGSVARAAVYVFDPGGQAPPTGMSDGSGNFDPTTSDFFNVSSGLVGMFGNTPADTALFGVGGTAGTVTVGTVTAGVLQFNAVSGSYVLNGGTIALDGGTGVPGVISLNAASGALTPTINSVLTGADGLLVQGNNVQNASQGLSVVTLGGANTYAGVTNISGGAAVSVSNLAAGGNFGNTSGIVLSGTVGTLPTTATPVSTAAAADVGAELMYTGTGTATSTAGLTLGGTILDTINVSNASAVLNISGPVGVATAATGGLFSKQGAGTLGFTNAANTFNFLFVNSGTLNLGTGTGAAQADTVNNSAGGNVLVVGYTNLAPAGASAANPNVATLNVLAGTTVTLTGQGASLANSNLSSSALAPNNQLDVLNVAGTLTNNNTFSDFSGAIGTGDVAVVNVLPGGVLNALSGIKFNTAALSATSTNVGTTYFNVSGGTVNVAPNNVTSLVRQAGGPVNVNLTSGQINVSATLDITNTALTTVTGTTVQAVSTINQSGGTFGIAGSLGFSTGVGVYNLSGGTLIVNSVTTGGTPAAGSGFVFNGGTLQANASSGAFFAVPSTTGMLGAQVGAGGGTINTGAFNDTIAQNFSTGVTGGTDGGLTKAGTGTLTLTGASTFTGATTISAGKLAVNGSLASPITVTTGALDGTGKVGPVTVGAGTGGIIDNGNGSTGVFTMNALTFLGTANDNVSISGSATTTPGQIVTNTLTTPTSGMVTLNVSAGTLTLGTYDLIQYGTLAGGGVSGFTLGSATLGNNETASLGTVTTNGVNDVVLIVTGSVDQFTGVNGTDFSTAADMNFRSTTTGAAVNFANGDLVLFDDTAKANSTTLNLGTAVAPASTTFNNSSLAYSINSTGGFGIGGTGTLVKNGTAALTINTSNTYTGGTTLNAGTLNVGNAAALSTGPLTINGGTLDNTSGATLQLSNSAIAVTNSFTFGGSGQLNTGNAAITLSNNPTVTVNGANQLFINGAISGTSSLTLAGPGTTTLQTISQFNSSNGTTADVGTLVSSGTLNLKTFFAPGVTNTNNNGGGTGLLLGPVNISSGAVVNANFVNALGYSPAKGVVTTLTVNGTFNDYVDNTQGLFTNVVLGGGSILERDAAAGGNPGNFNFNVNASSGSTTSITTTAGSAVSTFTMGVALVNGGTLPINAGSDLLITGPISGAAGAINKTGSGTLTIQDGYAAANSYTGGTTITGGTIRVSEQSATATTLLGTGATTIATGGTLGGNGSTGGAVVVAGTITGGATNALTGTLTTGVQTWNSTGQYVAKVFDASNTSTGTAGNDRLVMSGLTVASGFAVNISSGTVSSLPAGTVLVLADDTEAATTNPFNTSGGAAPAGLVLEVNGSTTTATTDNFTLATQADSLGNGGFDLVLEAGTAAAPEPTSLVLLGLIGAPLVLGRRRSARRSAAV